MAHLTDAMLDALLEREGGLADDPDDPGGLTNYGISQRTYPHEDIRGMTPERAKVLYRRDYWDQPRWGDIPDSGLAYQVFDMGVNAGQGRAFRLLHRVMGTREAPWWTPDLRAALRAATDWGLLREAYAEARRAYYRRAAAVRPKSRKYLKGWLRRATKVAAMVDSQPQKE